jgi:hypothetical protein
LRTYAVNGSLRAINGSSSAVDVPLDAVSGPSDAVNGSSHAFDLPLYAFRVSSNAFKVTLYAIDLSLYATQLSRDSVPGMRFAQGFRQLGRGETAEGVLWELEAPAVAVRLKGGRVHVSPHQDEGAAEEVLAQEIFEDGLAAQGLDGHRPPLSHGDGAEDSQVCGHVEGRGRRTFTGPIEPADAKLQGAGGLDQGGEAVRRKGHPQEVGRLHASSSG